MVVKAPARASGLVVALQANFCRVVLDGMGEAKDQPLLCTRRARLERSGDQLCVGDRVWVEAIDRTSGTGVVAAIDPRQGRPLERPPVANVARVLVVSALAEPTPDPLQLTRFLISAEATGVPVLPVLTKSDLASPEWRQAWNRRLELWGYQPILVSTVSGAGLDGLRQQLQQSGIAVLCGPSGVGKSSLLNALLPELQLRVASVSGRLRRGRHTTRHVELFPLGPGALLADTPGFNRPSLPRDPRTLADCFPELRAALAAGPCRFSNCLHRGDPGCAIGVGWDRFSFYRQCLEECLQEQQGRWRSARQP